MPDDDAPRTTTPLQMFAACLPGLEELLLAELRDLGAPSLESVPGGVAFGGGQRELYRANLCSGLATHVLLRLAEFPCRHVAQLRKKAADVPWGDLFARGQSFAVRATCKRSKLYHSGAVAERVALAIAETCGAEPVAPPAPGNKVAVPVVAVRVHEDVVSISFDTSGEPLHRRGWRLQVSKAPLREDLARALLLATTWDPATMLVDPMTGSGTIAIEAATLARGLAPGRLRSFAFENTALCDPRRLAAMRDELAEQARDSGPAVIFASDRDSGAVESARANATRAGVADDLELTCAPLRGAPLLCGEPAPGPHGALVCNPPHGRRVGDQAKLRNLYQSLGQLAQALPDTWRVGLCVADRRLALRTGLQLATAFLTGHGGQKVRAMVGSAGPPESQSP